MVPVPVPVFIPVPMNMYSQHTPVPMAMPLPVPVPVVVPPQKKEMKDAAVQLEVIEQPKGKEDAAREEMTDEAPNFSTDEKSKCDKTESHSSQVSPVTHGINEPESAVNQLNSQPEESTTTHHLPFTSAELEPPSSPVMDLENDFPSEVLGQKAVAAQRGVKRARESPGRKRARRRTGSAGRSKIVSASTKLNHLYGVNAWKSWVRQCNKQQPSENPLTIEEDILRCDSYQLSLALCRFIREVRRPNGESYSPDSTFYLCLGIQQYLFMKGRIENIFTDQLYSHFASDIAEMLKQWKPTPPLSGSVISSRVEESFLWECKQLGAYSPIVLLNTLLFFITKNLSFVTVEQHESLSFANIALCTKHCSKAGRVSYLLFKRSSMTNQGEKERLGKRQREEKENMELLENVSNPLHCPVRLYEFYLSKCPETVRKRTDFFFLQPEQNVHTHSSHWYTCQPLEKNTLQSMLTRILAVREVQEASQAKSSS